MASLELTATDWFPKLPALHERLLADPQARVADVGCGAAWSSIGYRLAYPKVRVDGFDLDHASVEPRAAQRDRDGVQDRVQIDLRYAGDPFNSRACTTSRLLS